MDALYLCRKIADIDGWAGVDTITNVGALVAVVDGKGGVIGKALLLDLMFKYEVSIDYDGGGEGSCQIISRLCLVLAETKFESECALPRAILECIIQANDL